MGNLENIPACLRIIARQIESGEIGADFGVLTLRKDGTTQSKVYGFGAAGMLDPEAELAFAAQELARCISTGSGEQTLPTE